MIQDIENMPKENVPKEEKWGGDDRPRGETVDEKCFEVTPANEAGGELPQKDIIDYPDGGLRAWGVVFGAFLTQFCGYGYMAAFGVYQDYYTRVYMTKYSASAISWIGSVNAFLIIATGLVVGRLYDKGHCRLLLYGGAFIMSLSLFMLSFVKPNQYIWALISQGFAFGIGGGLVYVPSLAIVSHYFVKNRAIAMSIITAGSPLGAVVNPILLNNLLWKTNLGFATVTRINAGFISSFLVIACILMKPRLEPPKKHANLKACIKKFSKDWAYIVLTAAFTLFAAGFFFPPFYLQLAATKHGLDREIIFYLLTIMNACSVVARASSGVIARVVKVEYLAIVAATVCGCTIFAFAAINSVASIVIIAVFYGFFSGIYAGIMPPLTSLLTDDMAELGIRLGISFACSGLGDLIGPPIGGALLTGQYLWWRPAVFFGVVVLGAGVCFGVVAVLIRGRDKT